ncbi:DnaD domain protein [Paenibacillus sp. KS-LC4]|uniref:DnaD domain-containing protein n=1 Tax=Paenibacillus sp. KS-LC4 TaxID=2979727 RepID=UPI0030CFEFBB
MSNDDIWKAYSRGMAAVMEEGGVHIYAVLLRSYRQLGLTDSELLLLLQLKAFRDVEGNGFPTPDELAERMDASEHSIVEQLGKLMKEGFLAIDEHLDSQTGIQSEQYNWSGWLLKAAEWAALEKRESKKAEKAQRQPVQRAANPVNLFHIFEQEFGRLLSPIECETISGWMDEDKYAEELIRFALKEAVFAGKLSFRYIDRILIEWSRNRVTNEDEARAHAQRFRGGRG